MKAVLRMQAARLAALCALWAGWQGACLAAWPSVPSPPAARNIDMGPELRVNGVPTRLRGHAVKMGPRQLADWYRQQLGEPMVESRLGRKLILGRAEGDHYLMVQIEPDRQGARAVIALTDLKAGQDNQPQLQSDKAHWLSRLPAGTQLVSLIDSHDAGRASRHMVFNNRHAESLNRERLKAAMAEDGYALEREQSVDGEAGGSLLLFKGEGKDGMATVQAAAGGVTTTVISTQVTSARRTP